MRKKLKRLNNIEDVIEIKRSKENPQVILKQRLKYTPKKCEDCHRMCPYRRTVTARLHLTYPIKFWGRQCSVCRQYYNPKTGKYNTSFISVMSHFCSKKDVK
jgi:hypothetical protein